LCYPGFGDSFYYRAVWVPGQDVGLLIPVTANGTDIPGCGFEGTPECDPVYVADCGGLLSCPPPRRACARAAAAWLAAAAAWWLLLHGSVS
jgi:hypothetical protein